MNKQWYKQDLCKVSFNSCALSIFWPKIIIYCPSCWKGDTVAFAAGNATRSIGPFLRQVNHTIVRTCGLTAARHNKYIIHLHQRGGIGAATAGLGAEPFEASPLTTLPVSISSKMVPCSSWKQTHGLQQGCKSQSQKYSRSIALWTCPSVGMPKKKQSPALEHVEFLCISQHQDQHILLYW